MKLMYCQDCGDIVAPHQTANKVRWCECKRHAVWWVNPSAGILRLWDAEEGPIMLRRGQPYPNRPRAYVIGLTNLMLGFPGQITAKDVQDIIDAHEDTYIFKRIRSMVIRIRPGESSDTGWAALPGDVGRPVPHHGSGPDNQ